MSPVTFDFGDGGGCGRRHDTLQHSAIVHGRCAAVRCVAAAAESAATAVRAHRVPLRHFRAFGNIFGRANTLVRVVLQLIVHQFAVAIVRFIRFLWIFKFIAFPIVVQFVAFVQNVVPICGGGTGTIPAAIGVAAKVHNDIGAVRRTGRGRSTV